MLGHVFLASSFISIAFTQTTIVSGVRPLVSESTSIAQPCALAAQSQAGSHQPLASIPAAVAYSCLKSVPVYKHDDLQLVDDIKLLLQWNPDTQQYKNLPVWYDNESFDLYSDLDAIKCGVENGTYTSEYDVQAAISSLLAQTGDLHIGWTSDISQVFTWQSGIALVSVSIDNCNPEVYVDSDVASMLGASNTFTASPVTSIDGEQIQSYLGRLGKALAYHDAHARYNLMFYSQAQTSLDEGLIKGYFSRGLYHGPKNTYTFKNGTIRTVDNIAVVNGNLTGVDDGQTFLTKLLSGGMAQPSPTVPSNTTNTQSASASASSSPSATTALLYPRPEMLQPDNFIGGYYLNDSEYSDVAVLTIPTFLPKYSTHAFSNQAAFDFQTVAKDFIAQAFKDGKKKMVVDLRSNGGGLTVLPFDVFKLFFPESTPYQAIRRRAHQGYKQMVDFVTYVGANFTAQGIDLRDPQYASNALLNEFYYKFFSITPNGTAFTSPSEFYGPHMSSDDSFTSLRGWNLSAVDGLLANTSIAGYGGPLAVPTSPFNASNILLLQDGSCSSSCAIFSELMRTAGVETLAIGGLPNDNIPMQKVGGTKGWKEWVADDLRSFSAAAYTEANATTIESWKGTELEAMNKTSVIYKRAVSFNINAADGIREGDTSETPLQFVYEAAECRIWYTPEMLFDVAKVWEAAARTKWGNGTCNAGPGWGKR